MSAARRVFQKVIDTFCARRGDVRIDVFPSPRRPGRVRIVAADADSLHVVATFDVTPDYAHGLAEQLSEVADDVDGRTCTFALDDAPPTVDALVAAAKTLFQRVKLFGEPTVAWELDAAAFLRGLEASRAAPAPATPDALLARVDAVVEKLADKRAEKFEALRERIRATLDSGVTLVCSALVSRSTEAGADAVAHDKDLAALRRAANEAFA